MGTGKENRFGELSVRCSIFPVVVTCKFWWKMADRKNNNVPNTSANLLFSAAPEFNFNLPFMPVSQATGPVVLSGGELEKRNPKG